MSDTSGTTAIAATSTATEKPADTGKILIFPTALAEHETSLLSPVDRRAVMSSARTEAALIDTAPPTGSAWERLAAVRRGRGDRSTKTPRAKRTRETATQPTVSELVTWLLNLRRGGVGAIYWNAAKLPLDVALVRAARLEDGAAIDVIGHRILVVEPLRARLEEPVAAQ